MHLFLPADQYDYRVLQLDDKSNNAAYTLRQVYQKHLLPYEEYDRDRETSAEASQCPPANSGSKASKRSSEPRDDAEEAADILNAIMGLSSLPQPEHAPAVKRAKSVGMVCATPLKLVGSLASARSSYADANTYTLIATGVRNRQSGLGPDPGARQHLHTQL